MTNVYTSPESLAFILHPWLPLSMRNPGAPRSTKHRHVDSRPLSKLLRTSIFLSAAGVRVRKTQDAHARNAQYAGLFCSLNLFIQCILHLRTAAMTPEQQQSVMDLRDPPTADDSDWEMLDDILHGDAPLEISHEGGELDALTNRVCETYVYFS
jgi:hypothetical protein